MTNEKDNTSKALDKLLKATQAINEGNYEDAIGLLQEVVELSKEDPK